MPSREPSGGIRRGWLGQERVEGGDVGALGLAVVARGAAGEAAVHPRPDVLLGPLRVGLQRLAAADRRGGLERCGPVGLGRRVAEGLERGEGDAAVALGRHVDAVLGPHPPVAQRVQAPLVDDVGAVAPGDAPDVGGVDRGPAAGGLDERGVGRVDRRRHEHVGAGRPDPGDGGLEPGGEAVEVGLGSQDVVAAADDADEVGLRATGRPRAGARRRRRACGRARRGWRSRSRAPRPRRSPTGATRAGRPSRRTRRRGRTSGRRRTCPR